MNKLATLIAIAAMSTASFAYAGDDDDDRGPAGPQGEQGVPGPQGPAGQDGKDGISFDYDRYMNDFASTAALGGLEMRTPNENQWTYSIGLGGISSENDTAEAISAGLRYGLSSSTSVYGKVSRSLQGDSNSWYVGFEGQF